MQSGLGFFELCVYKMNTYTLNIQLCWKKSGYALRGGETSVPFCSHRKEPMAQATFSCPFGAIHLEMRQGVCLR